MKHWTLFLLLLSLSTPAWAKTTTTKQPAARKAAPATTKATKATKVTVLSGVQRKKLFVAGNKLYADGKYQQAIAKFAALTRNPRWENFAVWYNLGNSYFRLQQYGIALGYYRKAQRLRPNHQHLLHNIQLLLSRVGKSSSNQRVRTKVLFWYYLFNLRQLLLLCGIALLLTLLVWGFTIRKGAEGKGQTLRWITMAAGAMTLVFGLSFGLKWSSERMQVRGVITQSKVSARSGYGRQFESLFLLTEADEVRILETVGKWMQVELTLTDSKKGTTRQQGWVPAAAVFKID